MFLGTEFLEALSTGFSSKDSSGVEKFITDDFECITTFRTMSRQVYLDWVASGGSPTTISNFEPIYENDEVSVIYHNIETRDSEGNARPGRLMCCGSKRDGKFYVLRVARASE